MTAKTKLHRHPLRSIYLWHRYFGIISALFVLILAVTGLLLQHTDTLQLNRHYLSNQLLLSWYGIKPDSITSFQSNGAWISHADEHVYLDGTAIATQREMLSGAFADEDMLAIVSDGEVLLLTRSGELIETFSVGNDLPEPALGIARDRAVIRGTSHYWQPDADFLSWQPFNGPHPKWIKPSQVPEPLYSAIQQHNLNHKIDWERFMLDLHTGRLFGRYGVFVMDIAAILLILLACSGLWVWSQRRKKDQSHRKH